jgi:WD40 repeat protein
MKQWHFVLAVCMLVLPTTTLGQPASAGREAQRLDRYEDPLPTGAILRLGTVRLRQSRGLAAVVFSPDGAQVASSGGYFPAQIWDVATGRRVARLAENVEDANSNDTIRALAYSPDGTKLATGNDRGELQLWDARAAKLLFKTPPAERFSGVSIYTIAFSPDGATIAAGGFEGQVRLYDANTGAHLLTLTVPRQNDDVEAVAISPDGNLLAAAGRMSVHYWDLRSGQELRVLPAERVTDLHFMPDNKTLITAGSRYIRGPQPRTGRSFGELIAWKIADGAQLPGFRTDEELPGQAVFDVSRDGKILVSGHTGKIIVWDAQSRSKVREIPGNPRYQYGANGRGLALSPDSKLVGMPVGTTPSNKIHLWNVQTGDPVHPQDDTHTSGIVSEAYSPDGRWIVTGSSDETVRLWDASTGEHVRKLDEGPGWVKYVDFLPDGKSVVIGREPHMPGEISFKGEVKVVRAADGGLVHRSETPDRFMCAAISPDGGRIAAGIGMGEGPGPFGDGEQDAKPKTMVFDAELGGHVAETAGQTGPIGSLVFSPDGLKIWSASEDGSTTLVRWNARTGTEEARAALPQTTLGSFHRVAFIRDAARIVLGGLQRIEAGKSTGKLAISNTNDLSTVWEKSLPESWPSVLAVSPNGRLIAAFLAPLEGVPTRGRIAVWRSEDGGELVSWDLAEGSVRSLSFSPDGRRLVTGMDLGDALVWDTEAAVTAN